MADLRAYLDCYFNDLQQTTYYYCHVNDKNTNMYDIHQGQVHNDVHADQLTQSLQGTWQKQKMVAVTTFQWLNQAGRLSLSRYMQQEAQPRLLAEFEGATAAITSFHCGQDIYHAWIGREAEQLILGWKVTGSRKNIEMLTYYCTYPDSFEVHQGAN